jgi:hypothetical protein
LRCARGTGPVHIRMGVGRRRALYRFVHRDLMDWMEAQQPQHVPSGPAVVGAGTTRAT